MFVLLLWRHLKIDEFVAVEPVVPGVPDRGEYRAHLNPEAGECVLMFHVDDPRNKHDLHKALAGPTPKAGEVALCDWAWFLKKTRSPQRPILILAEMKSSGWSRAIVQLENTFNRLTKELPDNNSWKKYGVYVFVVISSAAEPITPEYQNEVQRLREERSVQVWWFGEATNKDIDMRERLRRTLSELPPWPPGRQTPRRSAK